MWAAVLDMSEFGGIKQLNEPTCCHSRWEQLLPRKLAAVSAIRITTCRESSLPLCGRVEPFNCGAGAGRLL